MLMDYFWLLVTGGGAFLLGAAIAYAIMRQKALPPVTKEAQKREIDRLYERPPENNAR
ncbi:MULTISPECIES: hypothetical protein [Sinorhizobium]|uniref:Uncharacterized protein n=1 Tax=Rhizobium fredii TaxID=380 RepID=A0A2L0H9B6_RHIFR|nr:MULTISPECIES: hypothetical protein [Sinorhizobium]ASY58343.1 hypothetical protein SS05631_c34290 [Sinorhizobium sp. CCBAU 05631]AUX78017.1 hypothetical protein NXT3_CH03489 [Sinorhizobium fredii]PDT41156.1 hypothetical protein CO656_14180 [Sinorhizobium sp. FG01]PDT51751.1 hypothetical protein CO664_18010 [Sinorhizobium sp. NG07B]